MRCLFDGHNILRRRQILPADVGLNIAAQEAELPHLRRGDERNGRSLIPGPACTPDAVHIAFRILRQRIVDDVRQVVDVDTPRRHVRSHEDIYLPVTEFTQYLFTLCLRHVAVQALGRVSPFEKPVHQLVRPHLRAAEDDAIKFGSDVDDTRQGVELVRFAHLEINLVGQVGRQPGRFHAQHLHVAHVGPRKVHDTLRHGRRKEQDAPLSGRMRHNFLDILDESHVQHFVSLVQHEVADAGKVERPAPDVVEHAPRRPHHNIGPLRQPPELFAHGGSAVYGRDGKPLLPIVGGQLPRSPAGRVRASARGRWPARCPHRARAPVGWANRMRRSCPSPSGIER